MRKAFCSVPYVKCPTRRSGVCGSSLDGAALSSGATNLFPGYTTGTVASYGPYSDYLPVLYTAFQQMATEQDCTGWTRLVGVNTYFPVLASGPYAGQSAADCDGQLSPFRRAGRTVDNDANTWYGKDNTGHWQRGTSNQFIFGEKNVPDGLVSTNDTVFQHDHTFLGVAAFGNREHSIGRPLCEQYPIAKSKDQLTTITSSFGSWHVGKCHFALGNGSVRSVSATTPGNLLGKMANVQSLEVIALP